LLMALRRQAFRQMNDSYPLDVCVRRGGEADERERFLA